MAQGVSNGETGLRITGVTSRDFTFQTIETALKLSSLVSSHWVTRIQFTPLHPAFTGSSQGRSWVHSSFLGHQRSTRASPHCRVQGVDGPGWDEGRWEGGSPSLFLPAEISAQISGQVASLWTENFLESCSHL